MLYAEKARKKSLNLEASLREAQQKLSDMELEHQQQLENSVRDKNEVADQHRKKSLTLESSLREAQQKMADMESVHEDTLKVAGDDAQRELQRVQKRNLSLESSLREAQQKVADMESDHQQQLENSVRENSDNAEKARKKSLNLEASLREMEQKMLEMKSSHDHQLEQVSNELDRTRLMAKSENSEESDMLRLKFQQPQGKEDKLKNYLQTHKLVLSSATSSAVGDDIQKLHKKQTDFHDDLPWSPTSTELLDESVVQSSLGAIESRLADLVKLQEAARNVTTDIYKAESEHTRSIAELDNTLKESPARVAKTQRMVHKELLLRDVLLTSENDDFNTIRAAYQFEVIPRREPDLQLRPIPVSELAIRIAEVEQRHQDRLRLLSIGIGVDLFAVSSPNNISFDHFFSNESLIRNSITAAEASIFNTLRVLGSVRVPHDPAVNSSLESLVSFIVQEEISVRESIISVEENIAESVARFERHEKGALKLITSPNKVVKSIDVVVAREETKRIQILEQYDTFIRTLNSLNADSILRTQSATHHLTQQTLIESQQKLRDMESNYEDQLQRSTKQTSDLVEELRKKNRTLQSSLRESQQKGPTKALRHGV
eukprot:TRINITY_DN52_c0_g1_i5.p1 TRINITY_DN52_c0_g1~~TRINITY_DN52_c0_g1_i5.p1  ORF type:complete len:604 (+),score=156.60 TRINITY_DN52_c0_g1_i5:420-2231(+)